MENTEKKFYFKSFFNFFYNHMWLTVIILTTLSLIVSCGFLVFTTYDNSSILAGSSANDIFYHVNRIQGIADAWKGNGFLSFVSIYPNAINGYGYLSSLFYPDLFLYLPAILVYFGIPAINAYFFFMFLIGIIMGLIMYGFAKKLFKNKNVALVTSLLYVTQNYVIFDMFRRSALGEVLGLLFILIGCIGIYNLLHENYSKPHILLIAILGLTYSHLISLLFFALCLIVVVLINAKKLFTNKSFYLKTITIFILYLVLSLGFFLPFIRVNLLDEYMFSDPWTHVVNNQFNIIDVFFREMGIGIVFIFLIVFLRLKIKRTDENQNTIKIIDKLILAIIIISLIATGLFPWSYSIVSKTLGVVQYPWRVNMLLTPIAPILIVLLMKEFTLNRVKFSFNRFALLLVIIIPIYNMVGTIIAVGTDRLYFNYNSVSMAEYLPLSEHDRWEMLTHFSNNSQIVDSNGETINFTRDENTTNIYFNSTSDTSYYDLPLICYVDYVATINYNGEQETLKIEKNEYGAIRVLTNGLNGEVNVTYVTPKAHKIAVNTSFISAVLLIVGYSTYLIIKTNKKRKKSQPTKVNPIGVTSN